MIVLSHTGVLFFESTIVVRLCFTVSNNKKIRVFIENMWGVTFEIIHYPNVSQNICFMNIKKCGTRILIIGYFDFDEISISLKSILSFMSY